MRMMVVSRRFGKSCVALAFLVAAAPNGCGVPVPPIPGSIHVQAGYEWSAVGNPRPQRISIDLSMKADHAEHLGPVELHKEVSANQPDSSGIIAVDGHWAYPAHIAPAAGAVTIHWTVTTIATASGTRLSCFIRIVDDAGQVVQVLDTDPKVSVVPADRRGVILTSTCVAVVGH